MLAQQYTPFPAHVETIYKNNLFGREVLVETMYYGSQIGTIQNVCPSPFLGETGLTAYVTGNGWTDYIYLDQLVFVGNCTCTDCGRELAESMMRPECGLCLADCDCVTENAE